MAAEARSVVHVVVQVQVAVLVVRVAVAAAAAGAVEAREQGKRAHPAFRRIAGRLASSPKLGLFLGTTMSSLTTT